MTKYQMQDICSNFSSVFLLIDVEVAKTATSFWLFKALICIMTLLFTGIAFDVAQVLGLVLILFLLPW